MDYLLLSTHEEWIVISSTHVLKVLSKLYTYRLKEQLFECQFYMKSSTSDYNACLIGGPRVKNMAHPESVIKAKGTHIE